MTQSCGSCRHFEGQTFPKKPGWKHAGGKCRWTLPAPLVLPDSITRSHAGKAVRNIESMKGCMWPDDGETCPTWEKTNANG